MVVLTGPPAQIRTCEICFFMSLISFKESAEPNLLPPPPPPSPLFP